MPKQYAVAEFHSNHFICINLIIQIGLMRSGRLLAQASPDDLLVRYHCNSLEDVFLKLSRKQESIKDTNESSTSHLPDQPSDTEDEPYSYVSQDSDFVGQNLYQSKEQLITNGSDMEVSAAVCYVQ